MITVTLQMDNSRIEQLLMAEARLSVLKIMCDNNKYLSREDVMSVIFDPAELEAKKQAE